MGRKRKNKKTQSLPPKVYECYDKYQAKFWNGKKLISVGTYKTPEEAAYNAVVGQYGTHWEGIKEGPYFGFTYVITHRKTGKRYVGKKQFFLWDGPQGGYKCTSLESPWWDPKAWRKNDWEFYTGSSDDLNDEISAGNIWDFRYEVLEMCRTKLDLHVSEVNHMILWDVLEAVDKDGEYLWYNKNIASVEFRAPFRKKDVIAAKGQTEEAIRNYYLKPSLCHMCGGVIPFAAPCPCIKPVKVSLEARDFEDTTGGR